MSGRQSEHSETPLSKSALVRKIEAGWSPKYLLFWGHRAKNGSAVDKHVLSQWWGCRFEVDGVSYPSAEHFMMAEKARLFGDEDALAKILTAASPGAAKALGRTVRNFKPEIWDAVCFDIVTRGNTAKFGQNKSLCAYLLTTGKKVLVEASPVDRIWGIGLSADDPSAQKPAQWRGSNLLGFALMQARDDLQAEQV